MKQAELTVGAHYAWNDPQDWSRTRVRVQVTAAPDGGQVPVRVVTDGPAQARRARRRAGQKLTVETRRITDPWERWEQIAAEQAGEQAERDAQFERREAERARQGDIDPARPLPARYQRVARYYAPDADWDRLGFSDTTPYADDERLTGEKFTARVRASLHCTDTGQAERLFTGLPAVVRRDLLAAAEDPRTEHGLTYPNPAGHAPGSVTAVYWRAAIVLHEAAQAGRDLAHNQPAGIGRQILAAADVAFTATIRDQIEADGGTLTSTWAPPLPGDIPGTELAALGWLRMTAPYTSGVKLHRPGCRSTGGGRFDDTETLPLWQVVLARRDCGWCGGPSLVHLTEVAHLLAASAVWHARGRAVIEPWQRAAFARLVGATVTSRLTAGEPDRTPAAQVAAALAHDRPGEDGWAAYRLLAKAAGVNITHDVPEGSEARQALTLAARRLNQAAAALPVSGPLHAAVLGAQQRRTDDDTGAGGNGGDSAGGPLRAELGMQVLAGVYRRLERAVDLPQLDVLLWSLPGRRGAAR